MVPQEGGEDALWFPRRLVRVCSALPWPGLVSAVHMLIHSDPKKKKKKKEMVYRNEIKCMNYEIEI